MRGSQGTPSRKSVVHSKHVVCLEYEATVLLHSSFEQTVREVPPTICELQHHKYASEDILCGEDGGSLVSDNHLLIVEPSLMREITNERNFRWRQPMNLTPKFNLTRRVNEGSWKIQGI